MRAFDIVASIAGLIILSPVFLVIAFFVKISSRGPIIFQQERVGRNGHLFNLYKFRTMIDKADQHGTSVTTGKDPRITGLGRLLRKTKLDELPQLWNVLKGDMSFVGPRPDVPEIVNHYTDDMKKILEVRPGITSNATLHLRNEEELLSLAKDPDKAYEDIFVPAKIQLAMEHVNNTSFVFNFSVLIKTIWALTAGKIWPQKEHSFIAEIKEKIDILNNNYTETQTHTEVTQ